MHLKSVLQLYELCQKKHAKGSNNRIKKSTGKLGAYCFQKPHVALYFKV